MQIDFHHAVTYVLSRLAGFDQQESATIAHSCQYVDDATNSGFITFDNGKMYYRTSSAHKTIDTKNFTSDLNHMTWMPFHFVPGNGGLPAGKDPVGGDIEKLICCKNSNVAKDLVEHCFNALHKKKKPDAYLHQLGITLHTYGDTWAHKDFAGVVHPVNRISDFTIVNQSRIKRIKRWLALVWETVKSRVASLFINDVLPLGHGPALTHPDLPFLEFTYKDGNGNPKHRNNHELFMEAVDEIYSVLVKFQKGKYTGTKHKLPPKDRKQIEILFQHLKSDSEKKRHRRWIRAIALGLFSFGPEQISYIAKGEGSWKHIAIGTEKKKDKGTEVFKYKDSFETSDWKLFHDGLLKHREFMLRRILPKYGLEGL